jgi:hypothetical protein
MSFDKETGSATFFGAVPEGATVRVSMASNEQILQGVDEAMGEAVSSFPKTATPEGALVVSCCTRGWILGSQAGAELDQIRNKLGHQVPVSGFYSYGDIAPLEHGAAPRFHNETICTVLIGT